MANRRNNPFALEVYTTRLHGRNIINKLSDLSGVPSKNLPSFLRRFTINCLICGKRCRSLSEHLQKVLIFFDNIVLIYILVSSSRAWLN